MRDPLREILQRHHAYVPSDNDFQRRARLLQSLWREEQGLPIGEHRGQPLGSRLTLPGAKDTLANYLTGTIRDVVRAEVLDPVRSRGKLFGRPRIWNDLLSSQPLCFNLFGELQRDLPLASRVLGRLSGGRIATVSAIGFEHSPGRGDPKYTGDRSAFDLFVEYRTPNGAKGFVGIEVKYHEDLSDPPAPHRARYDEIAASIGTFEPSHAALLRTKPIQQIWRDHLLAGSLLLDGYRGIAEGLFAILYPAGNAACARASELYRTCLSDTRTFSAWTLEAVAGALRAEGAPAWVDTFADRYLAFDKIRL